MKLNRTELIKALVTGLKLDDNIFNYQTVAEEIELIQEQHFMDFYKKVMSAETFGNGLKAIIKVSKLFKPQEVNLLAGTKDLAKKMYDKFYSENCSMTTYTQENRDKVPNDREFFESTSYENLKRTDGTKTYSAQEIYVLNELGGGSWLMDIRFLPNTQVAINRIESIIKTAIITKYEKSVAIENPAVRKMLGRVA